jgi:DNA-binding XRE family transcriptional regulator
MPATTEAIPVEEFFQRHFAGQPEWAVALRGYRTRENLTQAQLAEATGIPQRHIAEMENGTRTIGRERARVLFSCRQQRGFQPLPGVMPSRRQRSRRSSRMRLCASGFGRSGEERLVGIGIASPELILTVVAYGGATIQIR